MGFASVIGQVFLAIMFTLIFTQLFIVQYNQNKIQTQLFEYQKAQLSKQTDSVIQLVSVSYNGTWNTTSLQLRNTGSTSYQINNSDLYIDGYKFPRNYTARKWFSCYEYTSQRCGELYFGDSQGNEETNLVLLYHFNNDSQWSAAKSAALIEEYRNLAANEVSLNTALINDTGMFDRGVYFNGVNAFLNRTNTAQNTFTNTSTYVWSFWIFPMAYGSPANVIFSKNAAALGYAIYINSVGRIAIRSPNLAYAYNSTRSVPLNQWSHITVVYDGGSPTGQIRFYFNGTSDSNLTVASRFRTDAANAFNIGRNVSSTNGYYSGLLDEFALYAGNKTDSDILYLYRKGVYAKGEFNFDPDEILEIDAYQNLTSGSHTVAFATQEGISVTGTVVVP